MNAPSSDDYIAALEAICADTHARRELLYLRALEKGDCEIVDDLERVDPDVRQRLERAGIDLSLPDDERDVDRRTRFARHYDDAWDRHAHRLTSKSSS